MTELMRAHREWATRPADERYTSLGDLAAAVGARRERSRDAVIDLGKVRLGTTGDVDGEIGVIGHSGAVATMSHWSFGQLAARVGAPAGYLRTLPALMARDNLAWGMKAREGQAIKLLADTGNGHGPSVRAVTSETYGRIWDADVVAAVERANGDGRWQIPAASYAGNDPVRATTLYASDRDVFLFLVDPSRPVDAGGRDGDLFRGFMVWNSEVGSATFGLCTFLYERVCDNRIIWGASQVHEIKIRHTSGGPGRFARDVAPALEAYADSGTRAITAAIQASRERSLGKTAEEAAAWLVGQGITQSAAKLGIAVAVEDGRDPTNAWDAVWGLTRAAQSITHTDARVDAERAASRFLVPVGE